AGAGEFALSHHCSVASASREREPEGAGLEEGPAFADRLRDDAVDGKGGDLAIEPGAWASVPDRRGRRRVTRLRFAAHRAILPEGQGGETSRLGRGVVKRVCCKIDGASFVERASLAQGISA